MPEIKARLWDKISQTFVQPSHGLNFQTRWAINIHSGKLLEVNCYPDVDHGDIVECYVYDSNDVVLQSYTGLKDINGKEIYEGDLIKADNYTFHHPVFFDKGAWCSDVYSDCEPLRRYNKIEVVGNILENPDWMEKD